MFGRHLIGLALLIATFSTAHITVAAAQSDTDNITYLRIFYHKGIRCGYIETPFSWHDKETKQVMGLASSMMETFTHNLGINLRWEEQITFGNMTAGLTENRYDAVCTPTIFKVDGARNGTYTDPLFFTGIFAYKLQGQESQITNIRDLNRSEFVLTFKQGSNEEKLAKKLYPKAKKLAVPSKGTLKDVIKNMIDGTAQYAVLSPSDAVEYNQQNDTKIEKLNDEPLRIFPYRLAFPADEFRLKHIFDLTIEDMINNGQMDAVLDLYDENRELYIRRKTPFR